MDLEKIILDMEYKFSMDLVGVNDFGFWVKFMDLE